MAKVIFDDVVGLRLVHLIGSAVFALFFLVSCGDSSSNADDAKAEGLTPEQMLPDCNESFEGITHALGDTVYVCSKGSWKLVEDTSEKDTSTVDSTKKIPLDKHDSVVTDSSVADTVKKSDSSAVADTAKKDSDQEQKPLEKKNVYISGVTEYGGFNSKTTVVAEELDASLKKTGVSFTGTFSSKDLSFSVKEATMTGPYVLITVAGSASNMALGSAVHSDDTLSVLALVDDSVSVNVNALSFMVAGRVMALLKNDASMTFAKASEKAIGEVWGFFGYDELKLFDPGEAYVADTKKTGAALLAASILLQSQVSDSVSNLYAIARNFAEGQVADSLSIAKMADWAFNEDMSDSYAEVRENVEKVGFSESRNEIPAFEFTLSAFFYKNLGLETCDEENEGKIAFATNRYSAYYAADYSDASVTKERLLCGNGLWKIASDREKDTYGFENAVEGEARQGLVNKDLIYSYNGTNWRLVTSLVEKDAYFVQQSNITDFVDLQEVYESIKDDERVIFLLRHGERDKDATSKNDPLSKNGYAECKKVGEKLKKFEEPFRLGASEFYRAQQTVIGMAVGRGQKDTVVADTFAFLNDDWYMIDRNLVNQAEGAAGGGWEAIGYYVYDGKYSEAYYDLEERSAQLIDTLLTTYADVPDRFILLSSHDKLMVPFVAYCSNRNINMNVKNGGTWINYLAGIAIIWDKSGNRRYVAFKGLESAYFRGW